MQGFEYRVWPVRYALGVLVEVLISGLAGHARAHLPDENGFQQCEVSLLAGVGGYGLYARVDLFCGVRVTV